jgi:hypothetical protein
MQIRTTVCVVVLVCLPLTVGCLGIPAIYAYPKISYFPSTDLNASGTSAEAFLVKRTCETGWPVRPPVIQYEVTRLPLTSNSQYDHKVSVNLESFAGTLGPLSYGNGVSHSLQIVLYRPGYNLVVIHPWEWTNTIEWTRAESIAAQEKAIDDLVEAAPFSPTQQRENLLVASEYARLAPMSDDCERLLHKAEQFRSMVDNGIRPAYKPAATATAGRPPQEETQR